MISSVSDELEVVVPGLVHAATAGSSGVTSLRSPWKGPRVEQYLESTAAMASEDFYPSITPVTLDCEWCLGLVLHTTDFVATLLLSNSERRNYSESGTTSDPRERILDSFWDF